jgi:hypothetical protein
MSLSHFDRERACSPGGGAGGAAESLVHSRDRRSRPGGFFNDMNAAFMSFQPRMKEAFMRYGPVLARPA